MAGRRSRSTHKHTPELRPLKPEEQARILAKLIRLRAALAAIDPERSGQKADLQLVHEEMLWVQREGSLRQENISRLATLFRQHDIA